jgi:cyclin-A
METDVLKFLNFEMGNPTIKTFLRRFIKAGQEDGKVVFFSFIWFLIIRS